MSSIRRPKLRTISQSDLLKRTSRADVVVESRPLKEKPKKSKITMADLKKATARVRALPTLIDQPLEPVIGFADKKPNLYINDESPLRRDDHPVKVPDTQPEISPSAFELGVDSKPITPPPASLSSVINTEVPSPMTKQDTPKKPRYSVKHRRFNPDDVELVVPVGSLAKLLSLVSCSLHSELSAVEELDLVSTLKTVLAAASVRPSQRNKEVKVDYFVDGIQQPTDLKVVLTDLVDKAEVVRQDLIQRAIEDLKSQAV